jgi:hypothetical protein
MLPLPRAQSGPEAFAFCRRRRGKGPHCSLSQFVHHGLIHRLLGGQGKPRRRLRCPLGVAQHLKQMAMPVHFLGFRVLGHIGLSRRLAWPKFGVYLKYPANRAFLRG